jgi:hypothetical protein
MWFAGLFPFVVALVLAAPAVAQQSPYTIHIPFRFNVSAHELPAGEYRVGIVSPGTVQIYGVDHIANAMVVAPRLNRSSHEPQSAELVFHRYGRQYFLSQAWFPDVDAGFELLTSNAEREYAARIPTTDTILRAAK